MNSVSAFDFTWAARQLAVFAALAFFPAIAFSYLVRRRLLMSVVLPLATLAWLWFIFQTWASIAGLWSFYGVPATRVHIGPSYLTILDTAWQFPLLLWSPFGLLWLAAWAWRRLSGVTAPLTNRVVAIILCGYLGLATFFTSACLGIAEYDHEDTIFADGFTLTRWNQVHSGMSRFQVYQVLGQPLDHRYCSFASDAECWVSNSSAGHFAAVWFDHDKATRVFRWYSD